MTSKMFFGCTPVNIFNTLPGALHTSLGLKSEEVPRAADTSLK